jgi:hypothetical protein
VTFYDFAYILFKFRFSYSISERQNVFGKEELLVMAKFETRGQIAGLFLAAGAVALLLIFLLTAEVIFF